MIKVNIFFLGGFGDWVMRCNSLAKYCICNDGWDVPDAPFMVSDFWTVENYL